jgi:hypothetical protein
MEMGVMTLARMPISSSKSRNLNWRNGILSELKISSSCALCFVLNSCLLFRYFEDLFARDVNKPTLVNVASKIYRGVSL